MLLRLRLRAANAGPPGDPLALFEQDTIDVSITDQTGNGHDLTVVSGTTWNDVVVNAPAADAEFIAADTTGIWYLADGTPRDVKLSMLLHNADNRVFAGDQMVLVYSERQTNSIAARAESKAGANEWVGGTFAWDGGQSATETFNVSTVGSAQWNINGALVNSGDNSVTTTGTKGITVGVRSGITSVNFYNTNISGDIGQLSEWRPTGGVLFHNTNISGNIGQLSEWRPTGNVYFSSTNISGDIGQLSEWRPTGSVYFSSTNISGDIGQLSEWRPPLNVNFSNTSISGDIGQLSEWRPASNVYFHNTNISGDIGQLSEWRPTGSINFYNTNVSLCSSPALFPTCDGSWRVELCTLNQAGVGNLLLSANNTGKSNKLINVSGGTNAAPDWGTEETPSAVALAVVELLDRDWTVTVTGGVPAWVTAMVPV